MRKYLDIHGKNIYTQNGKKIGFIENAVVNFKTKKITSYIVSNGKIIPKIFIIPLNRIVYIDNNMVSIGEITLYRKKLINRNKCFTVEGIISSEITNKESSLLGEVEDIILNESTGELKAIICKRGFFDDLIGGKKVFLINNVEMQKNKIIVHKGSIEIINQISFKNSFEEIS